RGTGTRESHTPRGSTRLSGPTSRARGGPATARGPTSSLPGGGWKGAAPTPPSRSSQGFRLVSFGALVGHRAGAGLVAPLDAAGKRQEARVGDHPVRRAHGGPRDVPRAEQGLEGLGEGECRVRGEGLVRSLRLRERGDKGAE